eukprot:3640148-Rhodomonas_salina.1
MPCPVLAYTLPRPCPILIWAVLVPGGEGGHVRIWDIKSSTVAGRSSSSSSGVLLIGDVRYWHSVWCLGDT